MPAKAKLCVILKADETVVAEIEDAKLWQKILGHINRGTAETDPELDMDEEDDALEDSNRAKPNSDAAVARFAKDLGVTLTEVTGALAPSKNAPYLVLDRHCWNAMKKGTSQRGPGAVSPSALAGTLLALWFKSASLDGSATQALAADVLKTIEVIDKNPSRGIKNTKWLQARAGGVIVVNAAEYDQALRVAKSFCKKDWASAGPN